ncbi:hypothetical protein ACFV9C_44080 [Kribbella sp. NPDC059898]|uniref:exo-rhamnogalacturonan lyase family protein n=1 Tax=Kribbella sp. NPDC059898 TaxID=3346995 RepID=UPI00364C8FDC
MVHTFVYDRDGQKDCVAGLGVRFSVPMRDPAYDRHVRFVGEGHAWWPRRRGHHRALARPGCRRPVRADRRDEAAGSGDQDKLASGLGYVGRVSGGFAFGPRDFWQRRPTQLDVRNAASDDAECTVWLWALAATSTKAAKWVSTNTTALYGLAATQTLALGGEQIVNR